MTYSNEYRRILQKLGYYNYQNGLIYRHLNQEGGWDKHLDRCRRFILKALEHYKPDKISVLGSGWLMELPLAEIIEKGIRVDLIDIVHPPEVIKQAGNLEKVELISEDVTGGLITEIWNKASGYSVFRKMKSLGDIIIPEYKRGDETGMVISLNILTQLESLPVDYLKKKASVKEVEYNRFRKEVQEKHISFLTKHRSVLISDIAEISRDRSGNTSTLRTLVADVPEGTFSEEWTWDFDMKSTDFNTRTSVMKVRAVII